MNIIGKSSVLGNRIVSSITAVDGARIKDDQTVQARELLREGFGV